MQHTLHTLPKVKPYKFRYIQNDNKIYLRNYTFVLHLTMKLLEAN
jgi:hypothetical protein